MQITLSKDILDVIDLSSLSKYVEWSKNNVQYFNMDPGKEHYKLLAYLSTVVEKGNILDLGTYHGMSAVALSYDEDKFVKSFDIFNWFPETGEMTAENRDNVKCYVMDYMSDIEELVKECDLVVIDIDHTGVTETQIMEELRKVGYKGLVFLDDINLNEEMRKFWAAIPEKKIDVSAVGHWSGSGIVIFDPTLYEVEIEL
jgi:hypothetical protein